MPVEPEILRRLAMVRYAANLGAEQCRAPEPLNAFGLNQVHDAVELFLQAAAEHFNAGKKRCEFIEYWDIISHANNGVPPTKKEAMRRLNTARVGFKHSGVAPSVAETTGFGRIALDFIRENISLLFGVDENYIDMVSLIQKEDVREGLKQAKELMDAGNLDDSMKTIAISFALAMEYCEERRRSDHDFYQTYSIRQQIRDQSRSTEGMLRGEISKNGDGRRLIELIGNLTSEIVEPLMVIAFNLDYEKYLRFRSISPKVLRYMSGRYDANWNLRQPELDRERVSECLLFVTDCAIRLQ